MCFMTFTQFYLPQNASHTCICPPDSELHRSLPCVYVLFFSRHRYEGWPHHGRTFYIYPCPLSFWLTLPRAVLSTSWCCPSNQCVVFFSCMHLALFIALSLSPVNSLVSSWCDHRMLVSLLWQWLTVPWCVCTHGHYIELSQKLWC